MKLAFCTLATNRRYLEGARYLYQSYVNTHLQYPFFIMTGNETDTIGYEDLPLKIVNKIQDKNHVPIAPGIDVFSKINAGLFTEYELIIFVDADTFFSSAQIVPKLLALNEYIQDNDLVTLPYDKDYLHENHNCLSAEFFALRPSIQAFNILLKQIPNTHDDETLFFDVGFNNLLKVRPMVWHSNKLNERTMSLFDTKELIHACNNFYTVDKKYKYWECPAGLKFYAEESLKPSQFN